jgi:hypothetical protein
LTACLICPFEHGSFFYLFVLSWTLEPHSGMPRKLTNVRTRFWNVLSDANDCSGRISRDLLVVQVRQPQQDPRPQRPCDDWPASADAHPVCSAAGHHGDVSPGPGALRRAASLAQRRPRGGACCHGTGRAGAGATGPHRSRAAGLGWQRRQPGARSAPYPRSATGTAPCGTALLTVPPPDPIFPAAWRAWSASGGTRAELRQRNQAASGATQGPCRWRRSSRL